MKPCSHGISETRRSLPPVQRMTLVSSMMAERHMPVRIKKLMNINVQRLFYSFWRMAVRETVQPWHLGNPPRLAACSAYGAGFLDDGRAPYASQNKKLMNINVQRLFYSFWRMAELFLQIYQISLVMLVIF